MHRLDPKFTPAAHQLLAMARAEAAEWQMNFVFTQHLLLACIGFGKGLAGNIFEKHGLQLETVRAEFRRFIEVDPHGLLETPVSLGPRVVEILAVCYQEAQAAGRPYIGIEHILVGLLRQADGIVVRVLTGLKVDAVALRQELVRAFDLRES